MAERTRRPTPPGAVQRNLEEKTVAERAADLSDEVLRSVESGRRAAIEAVRKFASTIEEATARHGDPSRRKTIIDAAVNFADELSTTQMELLHSVTRSASETLKGAAKPAAKAAAKPAAKAAAKPAAKAAAKPAAD